MKLVITMNQIGYFKPETTARRLKTYYYWGEGNPVIFLSYLRLIRLLSELTERVAPLRPALYAKEVREIYLDRQWQARPYLILFLREFREFFSESEWQELRQQYLALYPFLADFFIFSVEKRESLRLAIFLKTSLSTLMNTISSHHRIRKRNCRVNETLFK